jgi:hypothetical protein
MLNHHHIAQGWQLNTTCCTDMSGQSLMLQSPCALRKCSGCNACKVLKLCSLTSNPIMSTTQNMSVCQLTQLLSQSAACAGKCMCKSYSLEQQWPEFTAPTRRWRELYGCCGLCDCWSVLSGFSLSNTYSASGRTTMPGSGCSMICHALIKPSKPADNK